MPATTTRAPAPVRQVENLARRGWRKRRHVLNTLPLMKLRSVLRA